MKQTIPLSPKELLRTELFCLFLTWVIWSFSTFYVSAADLFALARQDASSDPMHVLWFLLSLGFRFLLCGCLLWACWRCRRVQREAGLSAAARLLVQLWCSCAVLFVLGQLFWNLAFPLMLNQSEALYTSFFSIFPYGFLAGWILGTLFPTLPLLLTGLVLRQWKLFLGAASLVPLTLLQAVVSVDCSMGVPLPALLFRAFLYALPCLLLFHLWRHFGRANSLRLTPLS